MNRVNLTPQVQFWFLGKTMDGKYLAREVSDVRQASVPKFLVLDLRQVRKTDSCGLAWLVNLNIRMREKDDFLVLLDPSRPVTEMLDEARVLSQFQIVPNAAGVHQMLLNNRFEFESLEISSAN